MRQQPQPRQHRIVHPSALQQQQARQAAAARRQTVGAGVGMGMGGHQQLLSQHQAEQLAEEQMAPTQPLPQPQQDQQPQPQRQQQQQPGSRAAGLVIEGDEYGPGLVVESGDGPVTGGDDSDDSSANSDGGGSSGGEGNPPTH